MKFGKLIVSPSFCISWRARITPVEQNSVMEELLSLVIKETALAYLIGQLLGGWKRQNRMLGRREVSQTPYLSSLVRCDGASCQVRHAETFLVRHHLMELHRLLNMRVIQEEARANGPGSV